MKLIQAVVPPESIHRVQDELIRVEVFRLTVSDVTAVVGDSAPGMTRGMSWGSAPSARLEIVVNENFVRPTLDALHRALKDDDDQAVTSADSKPSTKMSSIPSMKVTAAAVLSAPLASSVAEVTVKSMARLPELVVSTRVANVYEAVAPAAMSSGSLSKSNSTSSPIVAAGAEVATLAPEVMRAL